MKLTKHLQNQKEWNIKLIVINTTYMQNLIENKNLLIEALKNVLVVWHNPFHTIYLRTIGQKIHYVNTKDEKECEQTLDLIISLAIQNNLGHIAINQNGELKRIDGKPLAETSLVYYPKINVNVLNNGAKNIYEFVMFQNSPIRQI